MTLHKNGSNTNTEKKIEFVKIPQTQLNCYTNHSI